MPDRWRIFFMDFLNLIKTKPIVIFDGAMGTQLELRGVAGGPFSNLKSPDAVLDVQRAYVAAGVDALITNTFSMNRIYMETHNVDTDNSGYDLEELNRAAVGIARKAAGDRVCVLGEIGLTGQLLEPYGTFKVEQFYESFLEQAKILYADGKAVDAFIVETVTDLREALIALRAIKENFEKFPVIISLAYSTELKGGRTMMGNMAADCASALADGGADVIGLNCGSFDPRQAASIVAAYRSACALPILAEPNAGKPRLEGGITIYDTAPDVFAAEIVMPCIDAGATLIGGCCGTSPDHIREIAKFKR